MSARWLLLLLGFSTACARVDSSTVVVGSKSFTESVVLGEVLVQLAGECGVVAAHERGLGGTRLLWNALLRGDLDLYAEYTGTLTEEIFHGRELAGTAGLREALAQHGIELGEPLGFDNTYALGMRRDRASELGIRRISELARHPELSLGFSNEFMNRGDGWPGLSRRYELTQDARGLDHDLAYRGLEAGSLDVIDLYSTDAEIRHYDLSVLEDDRSYFPSYRAVVIYRRDLEQRAPALVSGLKRLEGRISAPEMVAMNARAKLERVPEAEVAADFLARSLGLEIEVQETALWARLGGRCMEHLALVGISLLAAILVALPLGVLSTLRPALGQLVLALAGILQTIPSLALLVIMIPLLGLGAGPAIAALFLYSLLPIVRNTTTGLRGIPIGVRESAAALGLSRAARMRLVELPMAASSILAGIQTAAVINVGTATLGALVGAGGFGQPILTGIRLDDDALILEGALPAAALALLVQVLFAWLQRVCVPRGLRL